jgi:hypothetical protein
VLSLRLEEVAEDFVDVSLGDIVEQDRTGRGRVCSVNILAEELVADAVKRGRLGSSAAKNDSILLFRSFAI